jgi:oligopeptide/dipeptide ABC transporter ATP-binding protein
MTVLLEVEDLHIHLTTPHGVLRAVDGVSFRVEAGRTLGIVGESGCGKTMTALSLMRLLPGVARIVGGSIRLDGEDIAHAPAERMAKLRGNAMAMIYQDPATSLNPVFSIGDQISEGVRVHHRVSRSTAWSRTVETLAHVGIPDPARAARSYPHQLSGGMRQRAVIAMALACRPRLLIADEPTTALDVTVQAQILDLLRRLRDESGAAIILITHDLGVVHESVDEVMVMYAGKAVEHAKTGVLFEAPAHPYTQGLLRAIPSLDRKQRRLPTIEGTVPSPFDMPVGCRFHPRCAMAQGICRQSSPPLLSDGRGASACWAVAGFRSEAAINAHATESV